MPILNNYEALCKYPSTRLNHSKIKLQENGIEYYLLNPNRINVDKYHVDGDIYKSGDGLRSDYLLIVDTDTIKRAYFVELKGKNIEHAIQQLLASQHDFANALPRKDGWDIHLRLVYRSGAKKMYKNDLRNKMRQIPNLYAADGGCMMRDSV